MSDFRREILGDWANDPNAQLLHKLAAEYHQRCDAYDRLVCGNLEGMPNGLGYSDQRCRMNENARNVECELIDRLPPELDIADLRTAIRKHVERMP